MKIALTGATGFVGSHILTDLHEHGYDVVAPVRDDNHADVAKSRGAEPVVIDLYDRPGPHHPAQHPLGTRRHAPPGQRRRRSRRVALASEPRGT
jgi:nucleoside-diphosphate-sugar epimerase